MFSDHTTLTALTKAAQGAYESFKASEMNADRLSLIESQIKHIGGKVDSGVDKMVAVVSSQRGSRSASPGRSPGPSASKVSYFLKTTTVIILKWPLS